MLLETITEIPDGMYEDDALLNSFVIPDSVIRIGHRAFSGCHNLKKIVLPESLCQIGWYAFSDCSSLECVMIPNHVNCLETGTFSGCVNLEKIGLNKVTKFGDLVFADCYKLKTVLLSKDNLSTLEMIKKTYPNICVVLV